MLNTSEAALFLLKMQTSFAQVVVDPITSKEAALVFSGSQFLVVLLAGVMMAFGFQLLLTNLSIAYLVSPGGTDVATDDLDDSSSLGSSIRKIEAKVGIWALATVSLALLAACFLAVKLSLINSVTLGAIVGVVVWSTYFSILMWFGSTTIGSLVGSIAKTATSGLQELLGMATSAIGANVAKNQAVSTAEDIAAAVRREITSGINPDAVRETLQSSLASLPIPHLNLDEIRGQFEKILNTADLQELADTDLFRNFDRQQFLTLIRDRTNLSQEDLDRIADSLESVWKNVRKTPAELPDQLLQTFKSATPEDLQSSQVYEQLESLIRAANHPHKASASLTNQALRYGVSSLLSAVQGRVDLSDVDVEKVSGQLQKIVDRTTQQATKVGEQIKDQAEKVGDQLQEQVADQPALPRNIIKADVENYLSGSLPWHLNRLTIQDEFRDIIYDPQADSREVRRQLEALNRSYFEDLLTRREDLSPGRIQESATLMEEVRQQVLAIVEQADAQEQANNLQTRVENYLRSTDKAQFNEAKIQQELQQLLEDPEAELETLQARFGQFNRDDLVNLLQQRQDLSQDEANQIVNQFETIRDRILNSAQELRNQATAKASEVRQRVEDYLRNTQKEELNPDAIERELKLVFEDPQAGLMALRSRLAQFDRETLVSLLSQRQDLSQEQVNQILDRVESVRDRILQAPRQLADTAKAQYDQTLTAIADYLRSTDLEELNPEGIRRDLTTLLNDPKAGGNALRSRLANVDRDTLVKLLSQRQDLSEAQVNRAIDQVQDTIRDFVRAPRRLVSRAQQQALTFESSLETYLKNTQKEELNPEGIKRDLSLLLSDPRAGVSSVGDRLSHVNRDTLVALLSQRKDITEEEANQIIDQVLSVRDAFAAQFEKLQQRFQSVIDRTTENLSHYLNSLNRPELNYEGIKQDFSKLFDDPQAGADALRNRLGQFDRNTLTAVLGSIPNLSETDADRIISQIETARDGVLHQADYIQHETQRRIKSLQHQAKKQALETQKAAATAAWWLFGTALTSLAASAMRVL